MMDTAYLKEKELKQKAKIGSSEPSCSIEACAAEVIASGESDAPDVVSAAGIVILPPPADGYGAETEVEASRLKWPKKPVSQSPTSSIPSRILCLMLRQRNLSQMIFISYWGLW
ncbi:unnamed protein product [Lactuca saligna]|uniref:Uncharacterized protein n=1 Tax=Lactuca saligna TaxID=75948 RepID=A0AA36EAW4_LACSI|nr:unnamed protein product [Lactuca saligna]